MNRRSFVLCSLAGALLAGAASAATPATGSVNAFAGTSWQGKQFVVTNPTSLVTGQVGEGNADCSNSLVYGIDQSCDVFQLVVSPPATGNYLVEIAIANTTEGDDFDLYVYDANGDMVGLSAGETGNERVGLSNLPAGTYDVVAAGWLVVPGNSYTGTARINTQVASGDLARTYRATPVPVNFEGVPANRGAGNKGQALKLQARSVGREAAEPTVAIRKNGTAFFVAGAFDSLPEESPAQTARSEVMRSRDGGLTWQSVQPVLPAVTSEPPTNLDPFLIVDAESGRIFSIDLYVGCSYLLYSDDEGVTWGRNPIACGSFVNDHQKVFLGNPPPGLATTAGYPNVIYYCFNRVADSSCGRSLDGGLTFLPTRQPAFLGADGGVCGGLHGEPVVDSQGRIFVPKGHCGFPWVSISTDGGDSWTRVQVSEYLGAADQEVNVTVDAADNVYVTWQDEENRLPYVAVSRDHGATWGTPLMVAPPGVVEVNFPAVAAGDAGRIALTFPGTTVGARGDLRRPWNGYVVVSTNALDEEPLFTWATVNAPADPIHRGNCGPGRCGGMFDFLDIQVSAADGDVWATAVDTCQGACVAGSGAADAMDGIAVRQLSGPWMWEKRRK